MIAVTRARNTLLVAAFFGFGFGTAQTAAADDPRLAPGRDPGGTAIAILADGFDYTKPDLAAVLARDGEGEAVAWDTVDGDGRPYLSANRGNAVALAAAAQGGVRIVQVRVDDADTASVARGIAFAVQTPAKIVFVPDAANNEAGRDVLAAAAKKFESVLFVASPASTGKETAGDVTNLILLGARTDGLDAAKTVARVLGCGQSALDGASGAELKAAFLRRLEEPAKCPPESDGKSRKP